jgi:two-component system, NarL family, response regulator LiaR
VIRILLADDHEFVRRGLRTLLELNPELQVVGEAADGGEAAELAMELAPDVVLMDLFMPGIDGTVGTQRIRQRLPGTEVIALTSVLEGSSVIRAIQSGAIACVLKDTRAVELLQAIKSAAAGHVQLNPKLAERLIREIKLADHATIDPGDRRVLLMIAEGWTNAMMAAELGIDERAMRTSTDRLLRKIGALSRTQAALYAVRTGIIALDQVGASSPDLLHRFDSGETDLHS